MPEKEGMDEIKEIFRSESAPKKEFVRSLRTELLSEKSSGRNNFILSLMRFFDRKQNRIGLLTFAGVVLLTGVFATGYMYMYQPKQAAMEADLLLKISEKNSDVFSNSVNNSRTVASATAQNDSAGNAKLAMYIDPATREYNYISTITTYSAGSALNKCSMAMPYAGQDVKKVESRSFFANKTDQWPSHTKYATYNNNGGLSLLLLTVGTTRTEYHGGKFAVKFLNQQQINPLAMSSDSGSAVARESTMPAKEDTATPSTTQNKLETMFGPEVKIVGKVSKNGKEYHKIQWTGAIFCNVMPVDLAASTSNISISSDEGKKGIYVALADTNSLEIVEEFVYLDSPTDANLVYSYTIEQVRKSNVSTNEVSGEFELDSKIAVRVIDDSKYDSNAEHLSYMKQYLQSSGINILESAAGFSISYLYSDKISYVPELQKYSQERDFYAPTAAGQKEYEDMKSAYVRDPKLYENSSDVRIQFVNQSQPNNGFSVSIYKGSMSATEAMKKYFNTQAATEEKDKVNVTIDGKKVSGTQFSLRQSESPDGEGSVPPSKGSDVSEPAMSMYDTKYVVFTYNNQTFIAEVTTETNVDVASKLQFKSVLSSDTKTLESIFSKISQLMKVAI